jgi:hypothetical protein
VDFIHSRGTLTNQNRRQARPNKKKKKTEFAQQEKPGQHSNEQEVFK